MINIKQAENALKNEIKGIKEIQNCKDYGSDYLFVAYKTNDKLKEIDPYYLVNKNTGSVRSYTIAEDPSKFYSSKSLYPTPKKYIL